VLWEVLGCFVLWEVLGCLCCGKCLVVLLRTS
jgi:hypothetical protein